jgi:uncharacterized protein
MHNRITAHIKLMPFTLRETKQYLESLKVKLTLKDITALYMAVGGVPYYLKDIKPGHSIAQTFNDLFFKSHALLKNEFNNLYTSLFKNGNLHVTIVKALAAKNKGLTRKEILTATKLTSGGGFSKLLDELVACGFVKIIYPINKTKEDCLFRLIDEYSIFYYKFLINSKVNSSWLQLTNTPSYKIWSGFAFENVCFKHIDEIKKSLGIQGIITNEYSWVHKGTVNESGVQIDLIIDRSDNCVNILELKFYDASFDITKKYAEQLQQKISSFKIKTKIKKNIFTTLIASCGARKNEYYLSAITNEVSLEHLF